MRWLLAIWLLLSSCLVRLSGGRSEVASTTWEGQRAWRNEGLSLGGVLRVSLDWVHLLAVDASDVLLVTVVLIHDGGLVSTTAIAEVDRTRLCVCRNGEVVPFAAGVEKNNRMSLLC